MHIQYVPNFVVAAVVLIREKDSVLMVQQNIGNHLWGIPGGLMENHETIEQAAIREAREETGLTIRVKRPITFYSIPKQTALTVSFECEITGGTMLQETDETSGCKFFPFDKLPELRPYHAAFLQDFINPAKELQFRLLED